MADALSAYSDAINRIAESDKRRLRESIAAHETTQDALSVERGVQRIASGSLAPQSVGAARTIKEFIEELFCGNDSDDSNNCE